MDITSIHEGCVRFIREYFEQNGKGFHAVVGISGGKDSSVVAALSAEALGTDHVIGVLMPCGEQSDIDCAYRLVDYLGIRRYVLDIAPALEGMRTAVGDRFALSEQSVRSLQPRLRMAALYAVAQSHDGRVANTCNLSEDWVGYSTRYGDAAGDFSPLARLTVTEVKALGHELGLPAELVEKVPIDGLCGKTDEDNLGFTYAALDRYIRTGEIDDPVAKERIDRLHRNNLYKLQPMPCYEPGL